MVRRLTRAGGIKAESKPVVVERRVAFGDVGADSVWLVVETMEREVDVAIVVRDPDIRPIRIGHPVAAIRVVRNPVAGRHRRNLRPRGIVEHTVDVRRQGGADHGIRCGNLSVCTAAQPQCQECGGNDQSGQTVRGYTLPP